LQKLYAILTIAGFVIPYYFFFAFFRTYGPDMELFFSSLVANSAMTAITVDMLLTSLVFWIFIFTRTDPAIKPRPWVFVVLNLTVGICCAFPAYLWAREHHNINKRKSSATAIF